MRIQHSANAKTFKNISERITSILPAISEDYLRYIIETISIPRHYNLVDSTVKTAKTYLDGFPVLGLSVYLGVEKYFPQLQRSDHAPFWHAKIPALMWTDTAEFRNTNYHSPWDTPETLDYSFMRQVAQLLLCRILLNEAHA